MAAQQIEQDWSKLSAEDVGKFKEELRLSRELGAVRHTERRLPYLPVFTGDSNGVEFNHFESAVKKVSDTNGETTVIQAIRKSCQGQAAKVLVALDYSTTKDELIEALEISFGPVKDSAASWATFYSAHQLPKETLVEWRTRLFVLYKKTGNKDNTDLHMKTRLYHGLANQKVKEQALFKFEDEMTDESGLLQFLRRMETHKPTVQVNAAQTETVAALERKVEELTKKLEGLTTSSKKKTPKPNKKKKKQEKQVRDSSDSDEEGLQQASVVSGRRDNKDYRDQRRPTRPDYRQENRPDYRQQNRDYRRPDYRRDNYRHDDRRDYRNNDYRHDDRRDRNNDYRHDDRRDYRNNDWRHDTRRDNYSDQRRDYYSDRTYSDRRGEEDRRVEEDRQYNRHKQDDRRPDQHTEHTKTPADQKTTTKGSN